MSVSNVSNSGARHLAGIVVFAVLVACLPLVTSSGVALNFAMMALYATLIAQAWNILGGFGGQFSFGHALFFGTGAYIQAIAQLQGGINAWVALPMAVAGSALVGLFVGALTFRYGLKGPYFSLVTLAFAEMLRVVAVNWKAVGSSLGLVVPNRGSAPALFLFADKLPYYYVILAMAVGAVVVTRMVERTRMGYALAAIRENEDAAEAAGVDALSTKLRAMALSSFLTALGGTFYAQYFSYIDPSLTFGPAISIGGLLPAIVGGAGTVAGPLLGSFVLTPISEVTRAVLRGRAGADIMLYGLVLILVISFLPNGLMGWIRAWRSAAGGRA